MPDNEKSLTLDDNSQASNPGALPVNYWSWITHKPLWPLIWGLALVGTIALAVVVNHFFWVLFVLVLFVNRLYWARVREQFFLGCINPSVVISTNPLLIATYTDLSMGKGEYPAIRITNPTLRRIAGQAPEKGMPVATISLYQRAVDSSIRHWEDFDPIPADYGTPDIREHQRILATLTPDEYAELQKYLEKVPTPNVPGVYYMFE